VHRSKCDVHKVFGIWLWHALRFTTISLMPWRWFLDYVSIIRCFSWSCHLLVFDKRISALIFCPYPYVIMDWGLDLGDHESLRCGEIRGLMSQQLNRLTQMFCSDLTYEIWRQREIHLRICIGPKIIKTELRLRKLLTTLIVRGCILFCPTVCSTYTHIVS